MSLTATIAPEKVCPGCLASLDGLSCLGCGQCYTEVAGIADLRLGSDRFLDLNAERDKASRLARLAPGLNLKGLAEAYYAMTPDVDPKRRELYLGHILAAEARGSALAALLPRTGTIVEVGCGTGGLLAASAKLGLDIEGVDIALRWLVVARRRLDDLGLAVPLVAASADRLPYADASVDTLVADSVLEHLDDPALAIREWARVLRPGGTLLVWSPNRYALTPDPHVRLWGLGWPPRCLSIGEARQMSAEAGFEAISLEPPIIPEAWANSRSETQRNLITLYSRARQITVCRTMLRSFGPLWQLQATRRGLA